MLFDAVGGRQNELPLPLQYSTPCQMQTSLLNQFFIFLTPVDSFLIEHHGVICLYSQACYSSSLPDALATPSFSFSSMETFSVDFQSSALSLSDRMGCEKW